MTYRASRRAFYFASAGALTLVACLSWSDRASAQDVSRETRASTVEEIVVTARRVEENLQEIPVSVTALSSESLARAGASNVSDIQMSVPNLSLGVTASRGPANQGTGGVAMRGQVGGNGGITNESAVGFHQDGAYLARTDDIYFELPDVQRVEVLRGPQGTLFGRNTTAGAINIITNDPTRGCPEEC